MLNVLANDHGAVTDADYSTFEITQAPAAGTVVPDPVTGRILYLSNAASTAGTDTFSYRLKTRAGTLSSPAAVNITITSAVADNIPVARGDTVAVLRGQSAAINVLANDTDPGGMLSAASLVIHTRPVSGVLSVNASTGMITYTHNNSAITADGFT